MRSRVTWTMVVCGVVLIGIGLMHFSLTALQEPGALERRIANLAKHSVIRLASRHGIPPPPPRASVEAGGTHFGLDCGICHGVDGRAQTPSGQWMYPRAADLTSKRVRAIGIRRCFGSSTMAPDPQGCRASANLRHRITFGVWSNTCGRCRVQGRG